MTDQEKKELLDDTQKRVFNFLVVCKNNNIDANNPEVIAMYDFKTGAWFAQPDEFVNA